jgi:hypothetical protein
MIDSRLNLMRITLFCIFLLVIYSYSVKGDMTVVEENTPNEELFSDSILEPCERVASA